MKSAIKLRWAKFNNWGDTLNPVLIQKISSRPVEYVSNNPDYLCVGSVLQWAKYNTTIWGTGFISSESTIKYPINVKAVRGPLTRNLLLRQGHTCPEIYGDPALLYPRYYRPNIQKKYRYGIIPHYIDQDNPWLMQFKNNPDVKIIDIIRKPIESDINGFINELLECEMVLSSSLHGIIAADAYNIPAYWIKLSDKVIGNGFKFNDYFLSVKRPCQPAIIIKQTDTIKKLSSQFYQYDTDIDLDLLFNAHPFK